MSDPYMEPYIRRARELMLNEEVTKRFLAIYSSGGICPDCGKTAVHMSEHEIVEHARLCYINLSEFGFVVMVRDRGQDEPRMLNKIYKTHIDATIVKHNLTINAGPLRRVNSAWVREATAEDVAKVGE